MLKKMIMNKKVASLVIKPLFRLNSFSEYLIDRFSIKLHEGVHPKHEIIGYEKWFLDNIKTGWVVADIGSNIGVTAKVLSSKASDVYGVEMEQAYVDEANQKRKAENIEYICADATTYDYSSLKKIDCLTLSNVLEHIEHRIDFIKKLKTNICWNDEANKMFLFRVPMIDRDWKVLYRKNIGMTYLSDKTHYTEYTEESFKEEMKSSGLEVIELSIRYGELYAVCKG